MVVLLSQIKRTRIRPLPVEFLHSRNIPVGTHGMDYRRTSSNLKKVGPLPKKFMALVYCWRAPLKVNDQFMAYKKEKCYMNN